MIRKIGSFMMISGLLLWMAAVSLTGYNLWDENRAMKVAGEIVVHLEEQISEKSIEETDDHLVSDREMPIIESDEDDYIGILEIPVLERKLPVIREWSYSKLRNAPCRYTGSVYQNNMIIAAHNYTRHFGNLQNLHTEDEIVFTDAEGNVFRYEVVEVEVLNPKAVEEMQAGNWDLTLFTCTLGGQSRITVRCVRKEYDVTSKRVSLSVQ